MLLTCPTCQSGLQVPDGTTAMVRCPACKTVFSPAAETAPPGEEPTPRKRHHKDEADDEKPENRDVNPPEPDEKPRRRRRPEVDDEDDKYSPEERTALKQAFARAAWGAKLIWISFTLFALSMMLIMVYYVQLSFKVQPSPAFIIGAGAIGAVYWSLAAVGVGLCASGPKSQGHWGYAIAAAVATGLHLILLIVLVGQGHDKQHRMDGQDDTEIRWSQVPTQLDKLTFYLTFIVYPDDDLVPKVKNALPVIVGLAEVLRNLLILMLLSCLARAAGDEELSHKCTRAAGFATFGPGVLSIVTFFFVVAMIETNSQYTTMAQVLFTTLEMGVYAILTGMLFPGLMAARETGDACDEPFQSQVPQL